MAQAGPWWVRTRRNAFRIGVRDDAKTELRIPVEDVAFGVQVGSEVRAHEFIVRQDTFQHFADLFSALGTGFRDQLGLAVGGERFERG